MSAAGRKGLAIRKMKARRAGRGRRLPPRLTSLRRGNVMDVDDGTPSLYTLSVQVENAEHTSLHQRLIGGERASLRQRLSYGNA